MTIEQTVTIPANHQISLNLPNELPVGKAKITITPQTEKHSADARRTIENLRGLAKRMGSTLTVNSFLEMRREDLRLEEEKYRRLLPQKG